VRVHVSLPLTGPSARSGREVLEGALTALDGRPGVPELVVHDSGWSDSTREAVSAARAAAADDAAVAYLGDFHSTHVLATQPILAAAGLLQVAPVATYAGLGGATLIRLTPHDGVGAAAIAEWLQARGVGSLLVVHDHDEDYGVPVAAMCVAAAHGLGIDVRSRPVWDHEADMAADVAGAGAVLYVGVAGSGAVRLFEALHALDPELWLLGSEGIAQDWLAEQLGPATAARMRFFIAARGPFGLYGHEAMALIRDCASGDRAATVAAVRAIRDRDSVLGRYSVGPDGHTTTTAYGRLAIVGGELVPDV
jgi:ABC-type branched-subunit amino acid transport system substrate-binding protein